jgi:hypothetical protein
MFVCCECCVLSGTGLCDEPITHPEESYRLCCVVVYDLQTSRMKRVGSQRHRKKSICNEVEILRQIILKYDKTGLTRFCFSGPDLLFPLRFVPLNAKCRAIDVCVF